MQYKLYLNDKANTYRMQGNRYYECGGETSLDPECEKFSYRYRSSNSKCGTSAPPLGGGGSDGGSDGGNNGGGNNGGTTASSQAPTKTEEPKPGPTKPSGCIDAHVYSLHCMRNNDPDNVSVQVWENGVLTCDESFEGTNLSGQEFKCGNGAKVLVHGQGALFGYTSSSGQAIEMKLVKDRPDSDVVCRDGKFGTAGGDALEVAWSAGDCSKCPDPPICKLPKCTEHNSYYEPTCEK